MNWAEAVRLVPNEMACTFTACDTPNQVRERVEPLWRKANSMFLTPPYLGLSLEQFTAHAAAVVAETF